MVEKIKLSEIIHLENLEDYKIHFSMKNLEKTEKALDVFARDEEEYKSWNAYKGDIDIWSRKYIFTLIEYYHEKNKWLFGGIFEVIGRHKDCYEIKLKEKYKNLIGRLIFDFHHGFQNRHVNLENFINEISISQILKEKYNGIYFPGYENINIDFLNLEQIFNNEKNDWKTALQNVKGIYLIFDKSNGKKYVGSAYGDSGIWSRWACYIGTGHGWNDELTKLIKKETKDYARQYFKFSLLEYHSMKRDDNFIIARENFWKEVFLSRDKFGYNKN